MGFFLSHLIKPLSPTKNSCGVRHIGAPDMKAKLTLRDAQLEKDQDVTMVMCIVVSCASKCDAAKGVGMFRIPSVIYNQGEETEELTRMRREKWISAIIRDDVNTKTS